jgi:hypothetical protein
MLRFRHDADSWLFQMYGERDSAAGSLTRYRGCPTNGADCQRPETKAEKLEPSKRKRQPDHNRKPMLFSCQHGPVTEDASIREEKGSKQIPREKNVGAPGVEYRLALPTRRRSRRS